MSESARPGETKPTEKKKKEAPTFEDFVTRWPLYTGFGTELFIKPKRISFFCTNRKCQKETTWILFRSESAGSPIFHYMQYRCGYCEDNQLTIFYRDSKWAAKQVTKVPLTAPDTEYVPVQIQKIGQFPALSIDIPKALQQNLGESATALYKKALINRNEGNGLGAVTYLRRVVEDKTDELIEVVAQLAESHDVDPEIVKKIRAVTKERTTYDNKLKIAATVLPASLTPGGANPIGQLYELVSEGLHDLSEEDCVAVADETRSVFEFTFARLRAEMEDRKGFVDKVTKWAGRNKPVARTS